MHHRLHVLGIGTLWNLNGLLVNPSGPNNAYMNGQNGRAAAPLIGDTPGTYPEVEEDGGPGTALGHWDEGKYDHELMTGYVEASGSHPISAMTVYGLIDLGYNVDLTQIDAYTLPRRQRRLRTPSSVTSTFRLDGDVAGVPMDTDGIVIPDPS